MLLTLYKISFFSVATFFPKLFLHQSLERSCNSSMSWYVRCHLLRSCHLDCAFIVAAAAIVWNGQFTLTWESIALNNEALKETQKHLALESIVCQVAFWALSLPNHRQNRGGKKKGRFWSQICSDVSWLSKLAKLDSLDFD